MRNLFGFRYFYFGLVALTFIVMLSSSVDATLFSNRCFLLANGTPCIQWDGSKFVLTNITVNGTGSTYTAQAPFLFLSGTTFNFNTTKANIDYNDTLYCDAGLGQKTKIFNASCNGNEVLREVYGGNLSSYYYCVNVTATGGGGNPFNQNLNTTNDVTFNNMNLSGTLLFPNNIGTQTLNSTGGTCGGQHYYGPDNCWHATTCTGEDIVC